LVGVGPDELTSRRLPAVAPLSDTKFAILGGMRDGEMQRDILVVDINERTIKLMENNCGMSFFSRSSAQMIETGSIASLVQDHQGILHLINYKEATNKITTLGNFGSAF